MKTLRIGNVGARLDDVGGLWVIDTIWAADDMVEIFDISDKTRTEPDTIAAADFWVLLDKF